MQIFQIKLVFSKQASYIERQFYYHILWAVLSLFENDDKIYQNILKISFSFDKEQFYVFLSVAWKQTFNQVVSILLKKQWEVFSINSYKFQLMKIDFNFKILDFDNLTLNPVEKFSLKFLSPTLVRNQNKIFTLPVPERFLYSVYQKLVKLWVFNEENKEFKKWLQFAVVPSKFNLQTEKIEIKKSFRAGVIGEISYIVYEQNEDFQKILDLILKSIPYIWLGSGVRLGLWNVKVYF